MGWPWSMLTAQVITLGAKVILSASNHAVIATAVHYVLKQLVLVQLDVQLGGLAITVTKQYVKPIHADGTVNALHPIYVDAPKKHTRLFTYDSDGEVTKIACEHQSWSGFVWGFIPTLLILGSILILLNFLHEGKYVTMCIEKED